jgi:hypothetical protein
LSDRAREEIAWAACCKRNDDTDRFSRISLARCDGSEGGERCCEYHDAYHLLCSFALFILNQ